MNKVDFLLTHPFSTLNKDDQITVQQLGPDHSCIFIVQKHKTQSRYFNTNWYYRKQWLTASENKKTLFCFYCLIYGGDVAWTQHGIKDLKHLSERIKNHERTVRHLENMSKMQAFQISVLDQKIPDEPGDSSMSNEIDNTFEIQSVKQEITEIPDSETFETEESLDVSEITSIKNELDIESGDESPTNKVPYKKLRTEEAVSSSGSSNRMLVDLVAGQNRFGTIDAIDLLFLSFANTLKTFSKKKQIMIKIEISKILMEAEIEELNERSDDN